MKKIRLLTNTFMIITFVIYIGGCVLSSLYMGTLSFIFSVLVPSVCLIVIFSVGLTILYHVHINDKMEQIRKNEKMKQLDIEIKHRLELMKIYDVSIDETKTKINAKHRKRGFIYLFEREDGILKIGRAYNPIKRLEEHKNDYQKEFKPIALWITNNIFKEEKKILKGTLKYKHHESKRNELRECCPYLMIEIINDILNRKSLNEFLESK